MKLKTVRPFLWVIVASFALLSMLSLGIGLGKELGRHSAQGQINADRIKAETASSIGKCRSLFKSSRGSADVCVKEAVKAARDEQRSDQELQAQQEMSDWAWWALFLSIVQLPVGMAGLFALIVTIRQGREANDISRQSVVDQTRPWITFTAELWQVEFSERTLSVKVRLQFKNIGQSPAIFLSYNPILLTEDTSSELIMNRHLADFIIEGEWHDVTLFHDEEWTSMCQTELVNLDDFDWLTLVVAARYKSPGSPSWNYTLRIYDFFDHRRRGQGMDGLDANEIRGIEMLRRDALPGYAT